jgi:folate-binding protein YgfZ
MSLETELTAILTAAAIAPITDRGFLRITGPDATRWLNGMVTNNIKDLAPGEGNYNFLLNAQGRIQGDCTIYREPGDGPATFLLTTDSRQLETAKQTLDKFIIMDDVELNQGLSFADINTSTPFGIVLIGEKASEPLGGAMMSSDEFPPTDAPLLGTLTATTYNGKHASLVLTPPHSPTPSFEIWSANATDLASIVDWLQRDGATPVSAAALEAYRILSGTPRYGTDIRNTDTARDLPQETAQTHALNFNKGCYLGQEIVERIHSRGQVHRTFSRFELTGDLPTLPCTLTLEGKPVGELTSAALIPLASGPTLRALGYIRREAATATLAYPNGTAKVLST